MDRLDQDDGRLGRELLPQYQPDSPTRPTAVQWIEHQAAKIPEGWKVIEGGARLYREQVLRLLKTQYGREIAVNTWHAYVSRGQAPAPVEHVGRAPLWDTNDIHTWATRGQ